MRFLAASLLVILALTLRPVYGQPVGDSAAISALPLSNRVNVPAQDGHPPRKVRAEMLKLRKDDPPVPTLLRRSIPPNQSSRNR